MHTRQVKNGLKPHIDYLKRVKEHYEDNRIILDYKRRGLQPSSGYLIDLGELGDDELYQDMLQMLNMPSSSSSFLVFFLLTYAPILTVFAYLIARSCIKLFIKDRFDSGADLFPD